MMNRPFLIWMIAIFLAFGVLTQPKLVQAAPLFQDGSAAQCAEGVELFFDDKSVEALPLLEAGFAGRENATFTDPDDKGLCALILGGLRNDRSYALEALEAYQVALKIFQDSGNRELEAITLSNIGVVYQSLGDYEKALEYYQQALAIQREVSNFSRERAILNKIGEVYYAQGRYEEALNAYQETLSIVHQEGNRAGEAVALNNIGEVYNAQGRYAEALELYQLVLTIQREIADRLGEGRTLNNIGQVYQNQGQYSLALEQYSRALEISREVGDRAGEGRTLNNIGQVYQNQGQYSLALEQFSRALEISREVGNRAGEGRTLNNIGQVYQNQGQYSLALEQYSRALEISREVGDRAGEGRTLNNIGQVYQNQGQYQLALEKLQQALLIMREVGDRAGEGRTLNNIGQIYQNQGQYSLALEQYSRALEISREVGDRAGEGRTLNNIGQVYQNQGQYELALEQYSLALEISREVGDRAGEGRTLNNIGQVYQNQGQYELALEQFQQALLIMREVGDRAGEGRTLNNIGQVYQNQGQYELALEQFQQALLIIREVGNRVGEGTTLNNIGLVYDQQGQSERALGFYEEALNVLESVRAVAGSEAGRASFMSQHADLCTSTIELYHQEGKDTEAFFTSERCRARTFLDSLATGYIQLSDDEVQALLHQEQEAYAQRRAIQDALARARALNPPDGELVADLEFELQNAEATYAAALAAIEAQSDQLAELVPGRSIVPGLSEIQSLLDEQTTLISYHILGNNETLAFILTAEELKVVPLGVGEQDLTEQIRAFSFSFAIPFLNELDPHQSDELLKLYQWLITPLKPHLKTRGVAIVPHDILHYLPFAALTDGETYFSDEYALFTLPSASVLPVIQENRKTDTTIESVLALGNPTFDEELLVQEGLILSDLPSAQQEVESIADLFGDKVQTLIGTDATESTFRERAGHANIVHVAAYGIYNPVHPLSSKLILAGDATNDGLLEVREVYDLELTDTTLVVLSACETGLRSLNKGHEVVMAGDEVVSLNRAFLFAGAESVLSSLWAVEDAATALLMERFYTHLRDGMDEVEALRQAQIDVREEYPHPYFWAGFVLTGLTSNYVPTPPPPPVWPWVLSLGSVLGLVFGLAGLAYASDLSPILLIRQRSHLFTVAREYRPYRQRWQNSSPLTRLIVLLTPLKEEVENEQLNQALAELNVPISSDQLENELSVAVRGGLLRQVDGKYSLAEPKLARALQGHEGPNAPLVLAKQIRNNHPLCINAHRFFLRAGFTTLTLVKEPLLYRSTPMSVNWQTFLPSIIYVRLLPDQTLNAQLVWNIRNKVKEVDDEASIVFTITDQRPTYDGWGQIVTLGYQSEPFTVLPIKSALINEGLAVGNEEARLREEIEKRLGAYDPYNVTTPVTDFNFFGRDDLVKTLLRRITSGQPVGIFGLRKLGKSSMLHALQEQAAFPVALVSLETIDPDESLADLYQRILDDLARWTPVRVGLNWKPPTIATEAPTRTFVRAIRDLLGRIEYARGEARVGIFLDEIELIVPRPERSGSDLTRYLSLLRPLRGVVDEGVSLSLVVAGLNPALNRFDDWHGERNPAFSLFEEVHLPPLADEDCIRMVRSIGTQIGLKYSEESLQMISELSGGHPFLARQLCSLLYKRRDRRDKNKPIEVLEVVNTAQRFIYDDSTVSRLVGIWQNAGDEELWGATSAKANQSILLSLARVGSSVPSDDLLNHPDSDARRAALINLERFHFIYQPQMGEYAIRFGLLEKWLRWRKLGLE